MSDTQSTKHCIQGLPKQGAIYRQSRGRHAHQDALVVVVRLFHIHGRSLVTRGRKYTKILLLKREAHRVRLRVVHRKAPTFTARATSIDEDVIIT